MAEFATNAESGLSAAEASQPAGLARPERDRRGAVAVGVGGGPDPAQGLDEPDADRGHRGQHADPGVVDGHDRGVPGRAQRGDGHPAGDEGPGQRGRPGQDDHPAGQGRARRHPDAGQRHRPGARGHREPGVRGHRARRRAADPLGHPGDPGGRADRGERPDQQGPVDASTATRWPSATARTCCSRTRRSPAAPGRWWSPRPAWAPRWARSPPCSRRWPRAGPRCRTSWTR